MNLDVFNDLISSLGQYGVLFDGYDFKQSMNLMGIEQSFSIDNDDVDIVVGKLKLLSKQLSVMDIGDKVNEDTVSDAIWHAKRLSWWLGEAHKADLQQIPNELLIYVASSLDTLVHRLEFRQIVIRTEKLYGLSGREIGIMACLGNGTIDNIKRCKTNALASTLKKLSQFTGVPIGGYHILPGEGSTKYAIDVKATRAHVESLVLRLNKVSLETAIDYAANLLDEQRSIIQPDSNILLRQQSVKSKAALKL